MYYVLSGYNVLSRDVLTGVDCTSSTYTVEPTYNEPLRTAIFSSLKARVRSARVT